MFQWTPRRLRFALNIYGPNLGAAIKVRRISPDWREVEVSMKLRWYNRNAVGVHFGGSLYAMVDPHLMLMLMQLLGKEYIVWDKAAEIDFVSPGRGEVFSKMSVSEEVLSEIRTAVDQGEVYYPEFRVEVRDKNNKCVARVKKVLYVRKK